MATDQSGIQNFIQSMSGTQTTAQANTPGATNNGNPNTVYNSPTWGTYVPKVTPAPTAGGLPSVSFNYLTAPYTPSQPGYVSPFAADPTAAMVLSQMPSSPSNVNNILGRLFTPPTGPITGGPGPGPAPTPTPTPTPTPSRPPFTGGTSINYGHNNQQTVGQQLGGKNSYNPINPIVYGPNNNIMDRDRTLDNLISELWRNGNLGSSDIARISGGKGDFGSFRQGLRNLLNQATGLGNDSKLDKNTGQNDDSWLEKTLGFISNMLSPVPGIKVYDSKTGQWIVQKGYWKPGQSNMNDTFKNIANKKFGGGGMGDNKAFQDLLKLADGSANEKSKKLPTKKKGK